ncbi:hypothetical protein IC582_026741 [Cucumis melo]
MRSSSSPFASPETHERGFSVSQPMIIGKDSSSVSTVIEIEWRRWLPRMRWR